jgi:YfiH family protein
MTQQMPSSWIVPQWPAPKHVRAIVTSREGGHSAAPFSGFNLGDRLGDDPAAVAANRALLMSILDLPAEPAWLCQVHGKSVVDAGRLTARVKADASYTDTPGVVCTVTTADCLPVLLCDRRESRVAVAHAGWRGLVAGVLEAVVDKLNVPAGQLYAWLGPAIGRHHFEVGEEVREAFIQRLRVNANGFAPSPSGRWLADLYHLARNHLHSAGVRNIYGGGFCTYSEADRFYSYRRDRTTGRMASLIWITLGGREL